MYPILMRLADRGLLETSWETGQPGGRPRRHLYRLTGAGAALAAELVAELATATVRKMLTDPIVAGFRLRQGGSSPGSWTPILDVATWRAVGAKLGGTRTVNRSDGGSDVIRRFEPRPRRTAGSAEHPPRWAARSRRARR